MTLDALVETEITSKVTPATADDAAKFFAANKARIQGDLASRREQIQSLLTAQRLEDRQHEFVATLRASAKIETFLTPPPVFRATISTAGAPVRGAATAPVTIIEFSDFHCPYCKAVQPALGQVLAKYGDKVKLVFRDYPVDVLHPQARAASEAARCATEQGKFWEFHDAMFAIGADATPATLDRLARNAGLDSLRSRRAAPPASTKPRYRPATTKAPRSEFPGRRPSSSTAASWSAPSRSTRSPRSSTKSSRLPPPVALAVRASVRLAASAASAAEKPPAPAVKMARFTCHLPFAICQRMRLALLAPQQPERVGNHEQRGAGVGDDRHPQRGDVRLPPGRRTRP